MEGSAGIAKSKITVGSGTQISGDFSGDAPEGTAEEDWDTVFAEIADARDAVSAEDVHASEHFRVGLLAGQWQVARTGRSVYGLRTDVKSNSPMRACCVALSLRFSSSFEYNKFDQNGAEFLLSFWQFRMAFLYT
eukprot:413979-Amphidinium_carterae.1